MLEADDIREAARLAKILYVTYFQHEREDGGPGSGNWGHGGVEGQVGGSAPGGGEQNRFQTPTGEFTSEAQQTAKEKEAEEKASEAASSSTSTPSTTHLAIDTPEARELYDSIQAGKRYSAEELANHPAVKQMDEESAKYSAMYPHLEKDQSPERQEMREQIKQDFLSAGSMVKNEEGEYEATGEITKGFEAEVVIGLPASGKSSTIANPDSEAMGAFVLDSDIIKESIPEFQETGGKAAGAVHEESKGILNSAFSEFKEGGSRNGDNLIVPVIGDDYDKLMSKWVEPLEQAGYNVKVKYKDTDTVESMNRNVAREIKTGRIITSEVTLGYGNKPQDVWNKLVEKGKYV